MDSWLERDRLAGWLLAAAIGCAGFVVLVAIGSGLTFFQDEWHLILRPDWSADSLLEPVNEHIWAAPIAIYKVLLGVFGMDSTAPFRVVGTLFVLLVAGLVFVLVRARLGTALALLVSAVLLFLGPAWEHLLWPVEIGFSGTLAAGLGAFLFLRRGDARGDLWAGALLVVSLAFSSLGIVFAAGAAVDVALRGERRLRRAWIPAVPLVLYLLWYAAYGQETDSAASLDNLLALPHYVWSSASSAMASLFGLSGIGSPQSRSLGVSAEFGRALLVAWLLLAGWLIVRRPAALSREFWIFALSGLAFWASAGLNQMPGREPGASRYQLIGAVFIVLITSELARGSRLARGWLWLAAVVAAASIVSNLGALREGEQFLREQSDADLAALAAIEGARDQIDDDFVFEPTFTGTPFPQPVPAGEYFATVDRWGSPVGDPDTALAGTEEARQAADSLLAAVFTLTLEPVPVPAIDPATRSRRCSPVDLDRSSGLAAVELGAAGVEIADADGGTAVRLRRWSETAYPIELGELSPGVTRLAVPDDELAPPWVAELSGRGPVEVCRLPPDA